MRPQTNASTPNQREAAFSFSVFILCLVFNFWGVHVGWQNKNLAGYGFRQSQTALSAFEIKEHRNFSIDYSTPVLGKPWAIPLEFPLFQWSAVAVSDWTGLGLVKSGRLVSLTCFYLMLPAVFLLLGNLGVAPGRRWLALALIVTSPIYIFYGRAFLIETMALMFGLWFWVAFERGVKDRNWRWLILAAVAGTGGGLVKVTTLILYLLAGAGWALRRLWATRRDRVWKQELGWMTAAVTIPLLATLVWTLHADAVRQLNPLAHFLSGKAFNEFNFGTWPTRLSLDLWLHKWQTASLHVTWWPVLIVALVLMFFSNRIRRLQCLGLISLFLIPLAIFPVLYGIHHYYFLANGVLLLTALGLVLIGVAENTRWSWAPALLVFIMAGGQAFWYTGSYYELQTSNIECDTTLTQSLRGLVQPDEVIVIVGQEWDPMIPFYTQRRAIMIREEELRNPTRLDAAFAALSGEKIGAIAISATVRNPADFLKRTTPFGIGTDPIYRWENVTVYLRKDTREESVRRIQQKGFPAVHWVPGVEPNPEHLAGKWIEVAGLSESQQVFFSGMNPVPVRFFSSFGPAIERGGDRMDFGAHPVTRLVFALAAGHHVLRTTVMMEPETYDSAQPSDQRTDGVQIVLTEFAPTGPGHEFYNRLINPRDNEADRRPSLLEIPFDLTQAGEVELLFGPGPAGRDTHDSISMGRLDIE